MLEFANIALGASGGVRCSKCHEAGAEGLHDATGLFDAVHEATDSWLSGPGPNLSFMGAEPFDHPALFELLGAAVDAGASRIRLETDAHALCSPEMVERVLDAGVRHLMAPLLGSNAELHDSLTGASGSFNKTLAGIERFVEGATQRGVKSHVTVRVPVCRHNLNDTPGIVTLAAKTGAKAVLLSIDDPDLDLRLASPWLEAACDTGVVYTTWVQVEGVPYGYADGWELHLASMYHKVEGEKPEACRACPLEEVCGGAMPGASQRVLDAFATPPDAVRIAGRIAHCFEPLERG